MNAFFYKKKFSQKIDFSRKQMIFEFFFRKWDFMTFFGYFQPKTALYRRKNLAVGKHVKKRTFLPDYRLLEIQKFYCIIRTIIFTDVQISDIQSVARCERTAPDPRKKVATIKPSKNAPGTRQTKSHVDILILRVALQV